MNINFVNIDFNKLKKNEPIFLFIRHILLDGLILKLFGILFASFLKIKQS